MFIVKPSAKNDESHCLMKTILVMIIAATSLTGCGTTRGILDGTGTVLEGVAKDLRSAGDMLGR